MEYKILLPAAVWQGYNPLDGDFCEAVLSKQTIGKNEITDYTIEVPINGTSVVVAVKCFVPENSSGNTLMLVPEYHRSPDMEFIEGLTESGYTVVIPDISGMGEPATVFPKEYAYGKYTQAGDHLRKVMPTAKETCQYLYSVIVKRSLAFLSEVLHFSLPILVGIGDAVEVAMQVVGSGALVKALGAINGSGYGEYIRQNKYGPGKEPELTEERMSWLSGVASVAYAKNINVPTFITFGTNSKNSDLDRLENLLALMSDSDVRVCLSPEAGGYINLNSFISFKCWLDGMFNGKYEPQTPRLSLVVRDDGIPRAEVIPDGSVAIKRVLVYFSLGEYNHSVRHWKKVDALTVGDGSYICSPKRYDVKDVAFAFAEVQYEGGVTLSSVPCYLDLRGQPMVTVGSYIPGHVLFEPIKDRENDDFTDVCGSIALLKGGKKMVTIPDGLKGITTDTEGIKTYQVGKTELLADTAILQADVYSDEETEVTFTLEEEINGVVREYSSIMEVKPSMGYFISGRLETGDFKCEDGYTPLHSWKGVKSLTITGSNVVIGNILFI